jgi:alpha-L-fucosidase 2
MRLKAEGRRAAMLYIVQRPDGHCFRAAYYIDPEYAQKVKELRQRMVPMQIGKYGQLMEWYKDFEDTEPHHRHISHAFGLYPAAQITKTKTPELFDAVATSIDRRLHFGGAGTGWSRAWVINLMARLGRGEDACDNVRDLFRGSTYYNLFDKHPPFQIDGNFGGSAGITEMVLQSHEGFINIIPAVPNTLNGTFRGLRARGGVTVSAKWSDGKVEWVELEPDNPTKIYLKVPGTDCMEIDLSERVHVDF